MGLHDVQVVITGSLFKTVWHNASDSVQMELEWLVTVAASFRD